MTPPIRLAIEPRQVETAPGGSTQVTLDLKNTSDEVEHLRVDVRGLPPRSSARAEPETVKLLPGASASLVLTVEAAGDPPADAGTYVLGVLARSPHRPQVSRCEELRLTVTAVPGLALTVEPEVVTGGSPAGYTTTLHNTGNTRLTVSLSGTDPERQVGFAFRPPDVRLRPRETAPVALSVRAARPWSGQEKRRVLTLTASGGEVTATATATLVQPPRLSPVALRVVTGVAGLAIVAAAALVGTRVLQSPADGDSGDGAPASAGESPAPTADPSASGQGDATPEPTALPTGTAPATPTATATPSPTSTPSPSPSAAPPPAQSPPVPVEVSFAEAPGGPGPRLVTDPPWEDQGIRLAGVPARGVEPGCGDAVAVAAAEDATGTYVTAASPTSEPTTCAASPLQVRFVGTAPPATGVELDLVAPGDYTVFVTTVDGPATPQSVTAPGGRLALDTAQGVTAVEIARGTGSPPPLVGLRAVRFAPGAGA